MTITGHFSLILSYGIASGIDIMSCIRSEKPL